MALLSLVISTYGFLRKHFLWPASHTPLPDLDPRGRAVTVERHTGDNPGLHDAGKYKNYAPWWAGSTAEKRIISPIVQRWTQTGLDKRDDFWNLAPGLITSQARVLSGLSVASQRATEEISEINWTDQCPGAGANGSRDGIDVMSLEATGPDQVASQTQAPKEDTRGEEKERETETSQEEYHPALWCVSEEQRFQSSLPGVKRRGLPPNPLGDLIKFRLRSLTESPPVCGPWIYLYVGWSRPGISAISPQQISAICLVHRSDTLRVFWFCVPQNLFIPVS
ncbi:hypothetical protein RRG08_038196 [Elysia crispata]|uniref:Uncharacterized protein n=1 Tax=Elysia crispata TaxID=231223 RepID=A0AAE1ANA0_9GAST|nr:hypothetical protein RRG08_038196 [Elysia crispata]